MVTRKCSFLYNFFFQVYHFQCSIHVAQNLIEENVENAKCLYIRSYFSGVNLGGMPKKETSSGI
jgi:hypothetical protein